MDQAAHAAPPPTRARDLAAATPSTRNRYVDLIRVVSIGVVVLGHWLMTVLGYRDGSFTGSNLLEIAPNLQWVTWVFQVMPLFFIVGGSTNAGSWDSARRRNETYAAWLRGRTTRLVRPALWFVGFWTLFPIVAVELGLLSSDVARIGGQEVALPLWFLAVYVLAVAAIPPLLALHRRLGGSRTFVALALGTLIVDVLRFGLGAGIVGAANYGFVWLAVMELGFLWREGALRRPPWLPWAMVGGGLVTLAVLVSAFDYPVSMIGLTHAPRSNAQPPSLALVALAVWQCGATLLLEGAGNRLLAGTRAWLAVVVANSMVMTFFLWNMSAVVLAAVLVFPTGLAPQPEPLSTAWWLLRPAWILVCAICIVPFLLAFRWAERPVPAAPDLRPSWLDRACSLLGTAAAGFGFGALAANAFPVPGEDLGPWPTIGVVLVGASAGLLRVDPVAPLRVRGASAT